MASPISGPPTLDTQPEQLTSKQSTANGAYLPYRSPSNGAHGNNRTAPQDEPQPNSMNALAQSQGTNVVDVKNGDRPRTASGRGKSHTNGNNQRRLSSTTRTCGKCGLSLTGQFVRALENTYHLECFTCNVCNLPCQGILTSLTLCRTVVR